MLIFAPEPGEKFAPERGAMIAALATMRHYAQNEGVKRWRMI
jgi:hypothetical protein